MRKRTNHRRQLWAERIFLLTLVVALGAIVTARVLSANEPPAQEAAPVEVTAIQVPDVSDLAGYIAPAVVETPARVGRYINVTMTDEERDELARIVYLEAGNQSAKGQQAVVEVVLNRVVSEDFPNTVHDVIHDDGGIGVVQFSTAAYIDTAEPTKAQQDAIDAALYGDSILPIDVVFFSRNGENDRVWGSIGDHVFCYGYVWE